MSETINTSRLVLSSVGSWALIPSGLFAWVATNPVGTDDITWMGRFCAAYIEYLQGFGMVGVVLGFLCAGVMYFLHRSDWLLSLKLLFLMVLVFLLLLLWTPSWSVAFQYFPLTLINPLLYLICTKRE